LGFWGFGVLGLNQLDVGGNKRIEPEFLDRNTKFGQLSFVSLDHGGVSFSDTLELLLNLSDSFVLVFFSLFEGILDLLELILIDVRSIEKVIELSFLYLNGLFDSLELLLENQVLETRLLVNLVDVREERIEDVFLLLLEVLIALELHFELPFHFLNDLLILLD